MFPNYNENESMFVYKVHHSLADGIATILMFFNICDDPDFKDVPKILVRFPIIQEILFTAAAPLIWAFYTYKTLTLPFNPNPFNTEKARNNMSAVKSVTLSRDIGVKDVKNAADRLTKETGKKLTFNDVIMAAFSKTLKDYCNT